MGWQKKCLVGSKGLVAVSLLKSHFSFFKKGIDFSCIDGSAAEVFQILTFSELTLSKLGEVNCACLVLVQKQLTGRGIPVGAHR